MQGENDWLLDSMTYSFSSLNSFENCKSGWYKTYILRMKTCGNFFSEYGKVVHNMLEKYAKDELSIFELNEYYDTEFAKISYVAPKNKYVDIRESYYNLGLDYINNIDLILDEYEVLGVEKKVNFVFAGRKFVGYIDLLLREKATGEIIVLDHKSRKIELLKNGELNAASKRALVEYKRQLYLYSIPVYEEYGEYPAKLRWNHFNKRLWNTVDFVLEEYEETKAWIEETISAIKEEENWYPNNENVFFCNELCGQRNNNCEYKLHR